jgi:hypothetical protein
MIFNKLALIVLAAGALSFTGCIKDEYYSPQPVAPQPVGYQYNFDDDFDRDMHNWSFSDIGNAAKVTVGGGTLQYIYEPENDGTNTVAIQTGANLNRDFLIQTRISSNNAMGLAFGVSDNDYGYSLMIDDQGYFALYDEGSSGVAARAIIDWQESSAIQEGWNDVELEQVDGYWIGYANGTKLFELKEKYMNGSKVGFIVFANTRGFADYLTVKW